MTHQERQYQRNHKLPSARVSKAPLFPPEYALKIVCEFLHSLDGSQTALSGMSLR